jgi:hypothetical protein
MLGSTATNGSNLGFYRFPPFSHFYTGILKMTGMVAGNVVIMVLAAAA